MTAVLKRWLVFWVMGAAIPLIWAGGSGLNVLVVVNQSSPNSLQLGNYYCERRQVPPLNYLRINWPGGNTIWTNSDFTNCLLNPVLSALASRQLTNQIDFVVLSMDIPYRIYQGGEAQTLGMNSTTAALFYGFKSDYASISYNPSSCNLPEGSSNSYAGSEGIFRSCPPLAAGTNSLLTMMITSSNLAEAQAIVDHGVAADGTFPNLPVILAQSTDIFRNIRYQSFDDAIFNTRLRGNYTMFRTNANSPYGLSNLLGYETGMQLFPISPNTFVPGAMADSLTSYGGLILEPVDHTTLLAFLNAGATGSYGTIVEPCAYFEKFPSPQAYFYQARGFTLAESYYQSVTNPYQGLLVGEPLSAPFALGPSGSGLNLPANALLSGTTNLSLRFDAPDAWHPLAQVDVFIDGQWFQTLTNISPEPGNLLDVTIRGHSMNYTVPAGATLQSIAAGLTAVLNTDSNTNLTKTFAVAHGDRIELKSFDLNTAGSQVTVSATSSKGTASTATTTIHASSPACLDSTAKGTRIGCLITNTPQLGDYLQLMIVKTNGQTVTVTVTNNVPGATLSQFATSFFNAINSNPALSSSDGVAVENVIMHEDWAIYGIYSADDHSGEFNLRARSAGWPASQAQVCVSGSPTFIIQPPGTNRLDQNVADLQPRSHLYLSAGTTNLSVAFALNTSHLADGFHELTAVAYEGSHVRTQGRVTQSIQVRNTSLTASFTASPAGSNLALEAALQFAVAANTNAISRIELFGTGGSLGRVSNQASASFSVAGPSLGIGLHAFYAVVTDTTGQQYRTQTQRIRLVGADSPFPIALTTPPPTLSWEATAGRSYEVLSASNANTAFQLEASLISASNTACWTDTNMPSVQRFYRVRTSN